MHRLFRFGGLTIVAPISSTTRNYPTYHQLRTTRKIQGKVMLDQTIALDLKARSVTQIEESLDKAELKEIIDKYIDYIESIKKVKNINNDFRRNEIIHKTNLNNELDILRNEIYLSTISECKDIFSICKTVKL